MKNLKFLSVLLFLFGAVHFAKAQDTKVTSGAISYQNGDFVKAITLLNEALKNPAELSEKALLKAYFYKGMAIMGAIRDTSFMKKNPMALMEAYNMLKTAREKDISQKFTEEIKLGISTIGQYMYMAAIALYNQKNYDMSLLALNYAMDIDSTDYTKYDLRGKIKFIKKDTLGAIPDLEKSISMYNTYRAKEKSAKVDSFMIETYEKLAYAYGVAKKDVPKAKAVIKKGYELFPKNPVLRYAELNLFLKSGDIQTTLQELEKEYESDPKNENVCRTFSSTLYNVGSTHYNEAAELSKKVNAAKDQKEIDELNVKIKENFRKALPYMERAHKVTPKDMSVLEALVKITTYLEMESESERYMKLQDEIMENH